MFVAGSGSYHLKGNQGVGKDGNIRHIQIKKSYDNFRYIIVENNHWYSF